MRPALVGSFLLAAMAGGCVQAPRWGGPMPVRNQHPAQLTVLHMPPARAAVLDAGAVAARFDAAYTSLWLSGQGTGRTWLMDGEYLRAGPSARIGLGRGLEFGIELPFAYTSGGFLDDFVIDYHDAFGLPDQGRDVAPRDGFAVRATRNGTEAWSVDSDGLQLLDVPLVLQWEVLPAGSGRLGLAARGAVELPSGDDEDGYGSGELEASCGMVAELHVGGLAFTGHAQHTFAGTPGAARRSGLHFADVTAIGGGVEAPLTPDLSLLVQTEYETSTLREFGLRTTDRDQAMLWIGARWRATTRCAVEVGFGEDLIGLVSPDFTAWLGMVVELGGAADPAPPPSYP